MVFEPVDRVDVQVVRWFIENEDICICRQRDSQGEALPLPTAEMSGLNSRRHESETVGKSDRLSIGSDDSPDGGTVWIPRILGESGHAEPRCADDVTCVVFDLARDDSEQRRLSGAIPAYHSDLLAGGDAERSPVEDNGLRK